MNAPNAIQKTPDFYRQSNAISGAAVHNADVNQLRIMPLPTAAMLMDSLRFYDEALRPCQLRMNLSCFPAFMYNFKLQILKAHAMLLGYALFRSSIEFHNHLAPMICPLAK